MGQNVEINYKIKAEGADQLKAAAAAQADVRKKTEESDSALQKIERRIAEVTATTERYIATTYKHVAAAGDYAKAARVTIESLAAIGAAYGAATLSVAQHASAADGLINAYRGVRLALSPTAFTAWTLGAGAATEALIKLTAAQARFVELTAIQAARNGNDFNNQYALNLASIRQNFNFDDAFQQYSSHRYNPTLIGFAEKLKNLGDIEDPVERFQKTMEEFGNEVGLKILPQLNERFLLNQQRIRDWGIGIDDTGRENLQHFKEDLKSFTRSFQEDADAIVLASKKVGLGISEAVADSYVFLKEHYNDFRGTLRERPEATPRTKALETDPSAFSGLFSQQETLDAGALIRGSKTFTTLPGALALPGQQAEHSLIPATREIANSGVLGSRSRIEHGERVGLQAEHLTTSARDREKTRLQSEVEEDRKFLYPEQGEKPEDGYLIPSLRAPHEQRIADAQRRLLDIDAQEQAEQARFEAQDRARQTAEQLRSLGQETELQQFSPDNFIGGTLDREGRAPQLRARLRQQVSNFRRDGASPAQLRQVSTDLTPQIRQAEIQDDLDRRRERDEQQVALSESFHNYGESVQRQFSNFGTTPQALFDELVSQGSARAEKNTETDRAENLIELNARRQGISQAADRANALATINAKPGTRGEQDAIQAGYETRLNLAKQLRDLDEETANKEQDADKKRIDLARARADYIRETQQAELARELQLAELEKRRSDRFQATAVDFLHAAQNHSLPDFFKQQGQKLLDRVVSNAADLVFPQVKKFESGLSLTHDPNSFLARLLAGTPFGIPARADGGPLGKGQISLVGERGPELFIPDSSGDVFSNIDLNRLMKAYLKGKVGVPPSGPGLSSAEQDDILRGAAKVLEGAGPFLGPAGVAPTALGVMADRIANPEDPNSLHLGMIPSKSNIREFTAKVARWREAYRLKEASEYNLPLDAIEPTPAHEAHAYYTTRYPKHRELATVRMDAPPIQPGTRGSYSDIFEQVTVTSANNNAEEMVEVLGHEFTHAVQQRRRPDIFDDYVQPPNIDDTALRHASPEYQAYRNHPSEVEARKGGTTAQNGYKKYLELLKDLHPEEHETRLKTQSKMSLQELLGFGAPEGSFFSLEPSGPRTIDGNALSVTDLRKMAETLDKHYSDLSEQYRGIGFGRDRTPQQIELQSKLDRELNGAAMIRRTINEELNSRGGASGVTHSVFGLDGDLPVAGGNIRIDENGDAVLDYIGSLRAGNGSSIMSLLEQRARGAGASRLRIDQAVPKARSFYERHGFTETGYDEENDYLQMSKDIPKFADGGIVDKPTIGEFGEAGPEAIVPLKNSGTGMSFTGSIDKNTAALTSLTQLLASNFAPHGGAHAATGALAATFPAVGGILKNINALDKALKSSSTIGQIDRVAAGEDSVRLNMPFTSGTASGSSASSASSTAAVSGFAKAAGTAFGVAAGGLDIFSGIKKGGARGVTQAIGGGLEVAAALDPEPISKAALAIGAGVTKLIGSFLGDPKAERQKNLTKELTAAKYNQPDAYDVSIDSSGRAVNRDFRGNYDVLKSNPTLQAYSSIYGFDPLNASHVLSYQNYRVGLSDPSRALDTQTPASSNQTNVYVSVPVNAIDSKSFVDHANDIGDAMVRVMQSTHRFNSDLAAAVRPF